MKFKKVVLPKDWLTATLTKSPAEAAEAHAKEAHKDFDSSLVVRWEFIECYKGGFLKGVQWARANDPEVLALKNAAIELRMYALGSDASTQNMIARFDLALAAYAAKQSGGSGG